MKLKKIVISANTSWYIYNFRLNTILSLVDAGYDVVVLAPNDKYADKLKEEFGITCVNIEIDQGGTNPIRDLVTFICFCKFYLFNDVSVVLNFTPKNNIYGALAAKMFGVKVVNNISGLGSIFINEGIVTKLAKLLYRFSQKYADKIFFQNEEDRQIFFDCCIIPDGITDRLPGSGVDLKRFSLHPSSDDGIVRFLLIARMLYDKGILHYIEAARELKYKYGGAVEFNLLGFLDVNNPSAISKEDMNRWVDDGIVNYLGVSDNVEYEIARADCMVLPSFYREGVPKSLLEAGAMGKPIITTDNIGCRETVEHGVNGFLCEPRSTKSLIIMLEKMINIGHDERLKMGLASRLKMEQEFSEEIVIEKYLAAIDELA